MKAQMKESMDGTFHLLSSISGNCTIYIQVPVMDFLIFWLASSLCHDSIRLKPKSDIIFFQQIDKDKIKSHYQDAGMFEKISALNTASK